MNPLARPDWTKMRTLTALRCTIGFAAPLLYAAAHGAYALGVLASLGALYTGLSSFRGAYPHRLKVMLGTSFLTATMTMIASCLSSRSELAVPAIAAAAFVFALVASTGQTANSLAVQAVAVLVVISGIPSTSANPLGNAGLVLAGGLFQTALLLVFWPIYGRRTERRAVADAYVSLAQYLRALSEPSAETVASSIPDRAVLQESWEIVGQAGPQANAGEGFELRRLMVDAEAIRAALAGLARALLNGKPASDDRDAVIQLTAELEELASSIRRGEPPLPASTREDVLPTNDAPLSDKNVKGWITLAARLVEEARTPRHATARPRPGMQISLRVLLKVLSIRELNWLSDKHALRYGLAVGVAVALSHVWPLGHAYWLPLTVCLTLREDYGSTLQRGISRVTGTLIGVGFAEALLSMLHPGQPILVASTIFAGCAACAVFQANYALYSGAITVYVIASVSAASVHPPHAGIERLTATVAGAVLSMVTIFLVPVWQSKEVATVLRHAIRSQIEFGERILAGRDDADDRQLAELQQTARALHIEAERIATGAEQEPRWIRKRKDLDPEAILGRLDENAAILLALGAVGRQAASSNFQESPFAGQAREALERSKELLDAFPPIDA